MFIKDVTNTEITFDVKYLILPTFVTLKGYMELLCSPKNTSPVRSTGKIKSKAKYTAFATIELPFKSQNI